MKITKTTESIKGRGEVTTFFVDGVAVATHRKFKEWFCTIKKGAPSNIRDRVKNARETSWIREGLEKVLGTTDFRVGYPTRSFTRVTETYDFYNDYPNTTWGYAGSALTVAKIKKLIEEFQSKQK